MLNYPNIVISRSGQETTCGLLLEYGSAIVHEALGRRGALGPTIRPLWPGARVSGPCRTVEIAAGDNLGVHHAIEKLEQGEVLCVGTAGSALYGAWGEIATLGALQRGAAGLVTACGVRDIEAIEELGFPVFGPGHSLQGTVKAHPGRQAVPVRIGAALVRTGDWVVCDSDGCVIVRASELETVIAAAASKVEAEQKVMAAIAKGASPRRALGLP